MLSTQQQIIIRQICRFQIDSFQRIKDNYLYELYNDMIEEEYEVTFYDIEEAINIELKLWLRVYREPNRFFNILNYIDRAMINHHLIQEFLSNPHTKGIWYKLNLVDDMDLDQRLN